MPRIPPVQSGSGIHCRNAQGFAAVEQFSTHLLTQHQLDVPEGGLRVKLGRRIARSFQTVWTSECPRNLGVCLKMAVSDPHSRLSKLRPFQSGRKGYFCNRTWGWL